MPPAAPPYPPSQTLRLAALSDETVRREDADGDNWPITWTADGSQIAAYGDGWGARPIERHTKANTGLVRLRGAADDFRVAEVEMPWFGGGAENPNFKGCGLLAVDGVLYHFLRYQVAAEGYRERQQVGSALIWSRDGGKTRENARAYVPGERPAGLFFDEPDHAFHSPTFLQAGKDYADAPDDYVYVYSPHEDRRRANDSLDMARVRRGNVAERGAYEYFAGLDGDRARWTRDATARSPVFRFDGHVNCGDVVSVASRRRYLLVTCGAEVGQPSSLALFEAPQPWGLWATVGYVSRWGGECDGDWRYDPRLPAAWLRESGGEIEAVLIYSDRIQSDKLNWQRLRLASAKRSGS